MKSTISRSSTANEHSGLEIKHCKKALESFEQALSHVAPQKKQKTCRIRMQLAMERLCRGEVLPKSDFSPEGNLPLDGGKFYAFKHIPIRAYCWYSKKHPSTIWISHYVFKNYQKLDESDTKRVHENYKRIEVDGHAE